MNNKLEKWIKNLIKVEPKYEYEVRKKIGSPKLIIFNEFSSIYAITRTFFGQKIRKNTTKFLIEENNQQRGTSSPFLDTSQYLKISSSINLFTFCRCLQ